MNDMLPDHVARSIAREEALQQQRIKQLTEIFDAAASRYQGDKTMHIPFTGEAHEAPKVSKVDGLRSQLTSINSAGLRKIADDCEKLIAGRMEDGVVE